MPAASTRLTFLAFLTSVLMLVAVPAHAAHSSPHAVDQIWAVVTQAEGEMGDVVIAFRTEAAGLDNEADVVAAEGEAVDDVDGIWADAKKAIEDLVKLYPGELGSVGGEAKQQLQDLRSESQTALSEITGSWVPAVPTTTTTLVHPPTTIPAGTTTTTSGTAVVPPRTGGTTGNSGPTNGQGGEGTSSPNEPGSTTAGPGEPTSESEVSSDLMATAQTPAQAEVSDDARTLDQDDAGITSRVSGMLETVLPPAIVDLVLSPLLILEILLRTSLAGGRQILIPLSLLALCAVLISLTDRFARRSAEPMPLTHP
ncbi:MAG TPA: hypothetical protein VJA46_10595 [Acidimicrobiia bacterium]|nr:hypothetical protein [Acidimicrobiia bacterium]